MAHTRSTTFKLAAVLTILGVFNSGCTLLDMILARVSDRCAEPTFMVTTTVDRNRSSCSAEDCSLREAITLSNICPGTQSISIPGGRYQLTITGADEDHNRTGDLDITDSVDIQGGDHTTIDGNLTDRVFDIHPDTDVRIHGGLIIQEGVAYDVPSLAAYPPDGGGGIRNAGSLHLDRCNIHYNSSSDPGDLRGFGGGILSFGPLLDINSCSIEHNSAGDSGGGIAVLVGTSTTSLSLHGNTGVSHNDAGTGGGLYLGPSTMGTLTQIGIYDNAARSSGGGIQNAGTLTLDQADISRNSANRPSATVGDGGGISNTGTLTATRVLLQANVAYEADALLTSNYASFSQSAVVNNRETSGLHKFAVETSGGTLDFENTTISGNDGGGVSATYDSHVNIRFTSIANNEGNGISAGYGSTVQIGDSIIGAAGTGGDDTCDRSPGHSYQTSLGYNIDMTGSCLLRGPGDQTGDPLLQALTNDGGTFVHPLMPGSPAIDTANSADCPAVDQRGASRPMGGGCDRGAYEVPVILPVVIATPTAAPTKPGIVVIPSMTPQGHINLTVAQNANCRRGPGTAYSVLTSAIAGQKVQLSGRNEDNTWWFTVLPGNNPCWLSMVAGVPDGDPSALPIHLYGPAPEATDEPLDCSAFANVNACEAAGCSWNPNKQLCH